MAVRRAFAGIVTLALWMLLPSCSKTPQQDALDQAVEHERQFQLMGPPNIGLLTTVEWEYRQALSMDPNTKWAKKAQERLDVIETKKAALSAAQRR